VMSLERPSAKSHIVAITVRLSTIGTDMESSQPPSIVVMAAVNCVLQSLPAASRSVVAC
jgi:hypothetical protein